MVSVEDFLIKITKTLGLQSQPKQYPYWQEVQQAIRPHLTGKMPKGIEEAFPLETATQLQYRKKVHKNHATAKLEQAIDDVRRIVMGSGMEVVLPSEVEYLFKPSPNSFSFKDFFFQKVYPFRVEDPNALLSIEADLGYEQLNPTKAYKPTMDIIPSRNIIIFTPDLVVVHWPRPFDPLNPFEYNKFRRYKVFTKTQTYYLEGAIGGPLGLMQGFSVTNHNLGFLPLQPLGGRLSSFIEDGFIYYYYKSDFSAAVPAMDDYEVLGNQTKVVVLSNAFPVRVIKSVNCQTCNGTGQILERDPQTGEVLTDSDGYDVTTSCKTCNGTGHIALGALDQIIVPEKAKINIDASEVKENLKDGYLAYVSPPIDTLRVMIEATQQAETEVEEVLNLTRPSKHAESGVSKEKDREGKYTFLESVASSVTNLMNFALETSIKLHWANEAQKQQQLLGESYVKSPQSFEIRTKAEIEAIFYQDFEKKPMTIRREQYLDMLRKIYGEDPLYFSIQSLVTQYVKGNNLRTAAELAELKGLGILDDKAVNFALAADFIAESVYKTGIRQDKLKLSKDMDTKLMELIAKAFEDYAKTLEKPEPPTPINEPISSNQIDNQWSQQ